MYPDAKTTMIRIRILSVCIWLGWLVSGGFTADGQGVQPRFVDLSHEQAFAPKGGTLALESRISMQVIARDEVLIASDLYGRCDEEKAKNVYTILLVNSANGSVVSRRTISARPESHYVIVDANRRPLLVSDQSLQVLDLQSLTTIRTVNFYEHDANPSVNNDEAGAENACGFRPFRISVTPDSRRIEVEIPHHAQENTDLFLIDGETLEFVHTLVAGFVPEFRIGFGGVYEHKGRRQWHWSEGTQDRQVCDKCDYLDVLSPESIVIGTNHEISLQTNGKVEWQAHFWGMRDRFAASDNGDRFVILAAASNGLFRGGISFTPILFTITRRSVERLPHIVMKQTGNIEGGLRSAIAMSSDGLQIAVFLEGRIALYNLDGR